MMGDGMSVDRMCVLRCYFRLTLSILPPPHSTRTNTLHPSPTLDRSATELREPVLSRAFQFRNNIDGRYRGPIEERFASALFHSRRGMDESGHLPNRDRKSTRLNSSH